MKRFLLKSYICIFLLTLLQTNVIAAPIDLDKVEISFDNKSWSKCDPDSSIIHQGNFYLRIPLKDYRLALTEYILYLDEQQEVEVFIDSTFVGKTGTLTPLKSRNFSNGFLIHTIGNSVQEAIRPTPTSAYIYLKCKHRIEKKIKSNFKLYSPQNWNSLTFQNRENNFLIQGLIGGALILITLYHFLIYIIRRDKPYMHYAVYTGLMFFVLWNETGLSQAILFTDYQFAHNFIEMSQILPMLCSLLYFLFMRSFIELDKLVPSLDNFIKWYLRISIPIGLILDTIYFFDLRRVWLSIGQISIFCTLFLGLTSVALIFRKRNKLVNYFLIGSLILYVFVFSNTILSILEHNDIIRNLPFDRMYLTEAGVMIEIVIFSLGLGYRMRLQQKEKLRLQELGTLKTKFFTNISHEFRTPLTLISGMTDQIAGHAKEKELIKRNSNSLLNLVNQLLDLSKLDTHNMSLQNIQGDIIPFLQYLTESFYSMANEKGVRLTFYTEVDSQMMDFDENKLQQIIFNLVGNAIKFTGEGGKVIVHITSIEKEQLHFKIKDSGVGMTSTTLEKIFDRFYQSNNAIDLGTGIGLSLTHELIKLMEGEISVKSEKGIGSEFIVRLPIRRNAPLQDIHYKTVYHNSLKPVENEENLEPIGEKPILLLVEDNYDIVTYIKRILANEYTIIVAKNGEEGVSMAQNHIPDIVVSDVMMPKLSGFELCNILKSTESTDHIPIILLTAKHSHEDKISGLSTGADAYITKPFDKKELQLQINNLLELRKRIQQESNLKKTGTNPENDFLAKVINYISENIAEPNLTVNSLSFFLGLSKMQVNRKIKAITGETPAAYISNYRLTKAIDLLQENELTVSEVAYAVGYSDPNYFSRAFSKKYGFSPSQIKDND